MNVRARLAIPEGALFSSSRVKHQCAARGWTVALRPTGASNSTITREPDEGNEAVPAVLEFGNDARACPRSGRWRRPPPSRPTANRGQTWRSARRPGGGTRRDKTHSCRTGLTLGWHRNNCRSWARLAVQQGIEEDLEGQIALRPHPENDRVTASNGCIDQGPTIGDHIFSHQPSGWQDVGGRIAGHYGQLGIPRRSARSIWRDRRELRM